MFLTHKTRGINMKNLNTIELYEVSGGIHLHHHHHDQDENKVDKFVDDSKEKIKDGWDEVRHSRIAENAKDAVERNNPFKHRD